MPEAIEPGTPVLLDAGDERTLVRVPEPGEAVEVDSLGVLAGSLFEDVALGERLKLGRRSVRVLPVTPEGAFETLNRSAQVIRPQDAARIAHACGVGPGTVVVEGGVGSGALTAYLAFLVGETGRVHGFEVRKDHMDTAKGNLERLGLDERVTWHAEDLAEADVDADAFVADLPDARGVLPAAARCLKPGGRLAVYAPLVSQVERAHEAIDEAPFERVRTLEQLTRDWVVHERGARPDFEMLGHTGFLTFATRVLEADEDEGEA